MRIIDAFAGIGGFSLAADALGWDTVAFVEREPSCRHWLSVHWPGVPIYGDITTVRWEDAPACDILTCGFPCQPASVAGKRAGQADERWLWDEVYRATRDIRPRYLVAENVSGLATLDDESEQPNDRCICGWPRRWRRVSLSDARARGDTAGTDGYGDGREGAPDAGSNGERVRREGALFTSGDGSLGAGVYVEPLGATPSSGTDSLDAAPADQGRAGTVALSADSVGGRTAEDGEDETSACLDCGGPCGGDADSCGCVGIEPEGAAEGEWRPIGGDCPSCGRCLGDEPTRLVRGGLYEIFRSLAEIGYDARWDHLSAAECGAPHRRERVWIVAHPEGERIHRRPEQAGRDELGGELRGVSNATQHGRERGEQEPTGRQAATPRAGGSVGNSELPTGARHGQLGGDGATATGGRRATSLRMGGGYAIRSPWYDAIPFRGADGTVRLIPQAAVAGPEPQVRALVDGVPDGLARQRPAEEAEPWPTPDGGGFNASADVEATLQRRTRVKAEQNNGNGFGLTVGQASNIFGGSGGPLWPVTMSTPGRVARLRAIGNAVVPAWVLHGPFRYICDREGIPF